MGMDKRAQKGMLLVGLRECGDSMRFGSVKEERKCVKV